MSKSRPKTDKQISIFEMIQSLSHPSTQEGALDVVEHLRMSLRTAIKGCPLSRHQIAGEMSHLVGRTVTKEVIDSWTREAPTPGPSRQGRGEGEEEGERRYHRHIPAEYLPAFCKITGSEEPLRLLGEAAGFFVLPGPEALRAEIQRLDEQIRDAQGRKRARTVFLREMEKPVGNGQ